jgi:hypothetical protein
VHRSGTGCHAGGQDAVRVAAGVLAGPVVTQRHSGVDDQMSMCLLTPALARAGLLHRADLRVG